MSDFISNTRLSQPFIPPNTTVCIVSHKQQKLILPLIDQLNVFCQASVAKIILIVNVPETDAISINDSKIPLEIIRNKNARGFGANQNFGFLKSSTDWFLSMNPDVRISEDIIEKLLRHATPTTGAIAPRIKEPGKSQLEPHRSLITPAELIRRRCKNHNAPQTPTWLPGLFMLFRRQAFSCVKGFDEKFFMYCEDFDICLRLTEAGWTLKHCDDIHIRHDARRDSHKRIKYLIWHLKSLVKVWTSAIFWRHLFVKQNPD